MAVARQPQINIIVAMAQNRVIGREGQLPWHLPSDLRRFRELTMGHTLLMGRATWESVGRALPGRRTIVLSRDPDFHPPGGEVVGSINAALELAAAGDELFVCGGEEVFLQLLPRAQRIYLTELDVPVAGDTFFPPLPPAQFRVVATERVADRIDYTFTILEREVHDA
ncbi:MAG: diacylglycerol kinase [Desulfuromonas sp.]|nr:MAG: diacylglycerol kinase [Desulfuromonas sp.]